MLYPAMAKDPPRKKLQAVARRDARPPGPPVVKTKPERVRSGILVQLSETENLLTLVNPFAPESAGNGEKNVPETPISKRRKGFRGLKFFEVTF